MFHYLSFQFQFQIHIQIFPPFSKMFQNVPKCSKIFLNFQNFQKLPKGSKNKKQTAAFEMIEKCFENEKKINNVDSTKAVIL